MHGQFRANTSRALALVCFLYFNCQIRGGLGLKTGPGNFRRPLRSHGLQASQLHLVARATTVASLLYASPAWWVFTSAEERARLERLIARLKCSGYLPQDFPTFEELAGPPTTSWSSPSSRIRTTFLGDTSRKRSLPGKPSS